MVERRNLTVFKRKSIRLKLTNTVLADITIREVKGKLVYTKSRKVLVHNISPEGLSFSTVLRFPVSKDCMLQFQIMLNGQTLNLQGYVVWSQKQDNMYYYGLQLTGISISRQQMISLLNDMLILQSPTNMKAHYKYRNLRPQMNMKNLFNIKGFQEKSQLY
ncbi:PilZ domain-containing protein [Paenibacillus beijingensis]|uniref:PilZ domain-containing protein n=1 Tax=Paenibacillus beijingensis TaxID=1126833 RepID=A0A0D5NFQ3_9BACL|nr:PilZ domain-containing protein [Paenibacillus beijingensis]AJY73980.1 hypothetical protein VN24_04315 [Paenibacillus beijingensis]